MELEYKTKLKPGFLPRFVSSVDFNGKEYIGEEATSKKETEQFAAQTAIKSLLALGSDSRSLAFIIMSKEIKFGWPVRKPIFGWPVAQVPPPALIPPSKGQGSLGPHTGAQVPTPTLIPPSARQGSLVPYTGAQLHAPAQAALIPPSTRRGRLIHVPSLGPLTGGQDKRGKSFKKQRTAQADSTLLPHSTEPRRSNRMRKPTTRLRESLENQSNYNDSIDFS